jgi:hypothetical protein
VSQELENKVDFKSCFIRWISVISSILMQFIFNLTLYSNLNTDPMGETKFGTNFSLKSLGHPRFQSYREESQFMYSFSTKSWIISWSLPTGTYHKYHINFIYQRNIITVWMKSKHKKIKTTIVTNKYLHPNLISGK